MLQTVFVIPQINFCFKGLKVNFIFLQVRRFISVPGIRIRKQDNLPSKYRYRATCLGFRIWQSFGRFGNFLELHKRMCIVQRTVTIWGLRFTTLNYHSFRPFFYYLKMPMDDKDSRFSNLVNLSLTNIGEARSRLEKRIVKLMDRGRVTRPRVEYAIFV